VIAVSEHDRRLLSAGMDDSRVSVVPTGVDLEHYRPDSSGREPSPLLMFVGAMDWEPNIDAVEYFCKRIWPAVQAAVPGAHFRIVGRNPDRRVLSLAGGPVEVTGRVHSVADQLHEAAVVVVPLRIGGGTRLKIYEAMATGKAVVSTSVGAEGLDVHPGKDILLADTPETFCDSIVTLLRDRELRKSFERSAAQLAAVHGWQSVGEKFASVLRRIAGLGTAMSGQRLSAVGATSYGADLPARD